MNKNCSKCKNYFEKLYCVESVGEPLCKKCYNSFVDYSNEVKRRLIKAKKVSKEEITFIEKV